MPNHILSLLNTEGDPQKLKLSLIIISSSTIALKAFCSLATKTRPISSPLASQTFYQLFITTGYKVSLGIMCIVLIYLLINYLITIAKELLQKKSKALIPKIESYKKHQLTIEKEYFKSNDPYDTLELRTLEYSIPEEPIRHEDAISNDPEWVDIDEELGTITYRHLLFNRYAQLLLVTKQIITLGLPVIIACYAISISNHFLRLVVSLTWPF